MAKALAGLAIAYGVASVAVALDPIVPTTYFATSPLAASADLAAGLGLIGAGLLVTWERPRGSLGPLTTLAGAVWLAPDWVGWEGGPALARSVAMVAPFFLLPLVLHLVLAVPAGKVTALAARSAVGAAYALAALIGVGRALFRDPFLDVDCSSNCTDNVFLVHSAQGLTSALDDIWLWVWPIGWSLVAAVAGARLLSASRAARAELWPVLGAAMLVAGVQVAYGVALLRDRAEDPDGTTFHALFLARAATLTCLAAGVAWIAVRRHRAKAAIARLANDLGEAPEPGSLESALSRSLGDPDLRVAYWRAGSPPYVDAEGRPVATRSDDGLVSTPIVRNGEPVALVVHDRGLSVALERELGSATRMAVDNERMRAAVLAQLQDLRSSRARIVEAGDSARRRIERDLHDGAQQRLLTLSYELRLARAAAERDGQTDVATVLASTGAEIQVALEELRDLAHGIHPAILTEAGLGPALASLADQTPLPVEIEGLMADRHPEAVERALYVAIEEAVADAAVRRASHVRVRIGREGQALIAEVVDDGAERLGNVIAEDRVGALGGAVAVRPELLRVEVPCE